MKRKSQRNIVAFRSADGGIAELNNSAIKLVLGALIPIVLSFVEKFKYKKLKFLEKISLGFSGLAGIGVILEEATKIPDEAWNGDNYSPAEIADISAYVESLLPPDMKGRARELTLSLLPLVLQLVSTVDLVVTISGDDGEGEPESEA